MLYQALIFYRQNYKYFLRFVQFLLHIAQTLLIFNFVR
jgi:hypothetical protein